MFSIPIARRSSCFAVHDRSPARYKRAWSMFNDVGGWDRTEIDIDSDDRASWIENGSPCPELEFGSDGENEGGRLSKRFTTYPMHICFCQLVLAVFMKSCHEVSTWLKAESWGSAKPASHQVMRRGVTGVLPSNWLAIRDILVPKFCTADTAMTMCWKSAKHRTEKEGSMALLEALRSERNSWPFVEFVASRDRNGCWLWSSSARFCFQTQQGIVCRLSAEDSLWTLTIKKLTDLSLIKLLSLIKVRCTLPSWSFFLIKTAKKRVTAVHKIGHKTSFERNIWVLFSLRWLLSRCLRRCWCQKLKINILGLRFRFYLTGSQILFSFSSDKDRKTDSRMRCVFSSDPAVSSSIFVGAEREENLIKNLYILGHCSG